MIISNREIGSKWIGWNGLGGGYEVDTKQMLRLVPGVKYMFIQKWSPYYTLHKTS